MGEAPENTLPSFQQALQDGASFVELDVHGSSDGEAVIIHDETLERTTEGRGRVSERSLKELKALDAGYRFSPDEGRTFPYRGRRIEIPTLNEFLLKFPEVKKIIELKQLRPSIAERVIEVVAAHGSEEQVLLATENDDIMRAIRRRLAAAPARIATGFSFGEVAAFYHWVVQGRKGAYDPPGQALQVPRTYQDQVLVTEDTVDAAHALGLEVFVWTVNEVNEMKSLLALGVDGIITDYPARLGRLLRSDR